MGISTQPLLESYSRYGPWITNCWLKSLWEKCNKYDIRVEFNDVKIALPRVGDQWLMNLFVRLGYSDQDLVRLNRVRISSQVLFLSDILGASGKLLDTKYLHRRKAEEIWSDYNFPRETHQTRTSTSGE